MPLGRPWQWCGRNKKRRLNCIHVKLGLRRSKAGWKSEPVTYLVSQWWADDWPIGALTQSETLPQLGRNSGMETDGVSGPSFETWPVSSTKFLYVIHSIREPLTFHFLPYPSYTITCRCAKSSRSMTCSCTHPNLYIRSLGCGLYSMNISIEQYCVTCEIVVFRYFCLRNAMFWKVNLWGWSAVCISLDS